jgi:SAM-dependent methyltransferase
MGLCVDADHPQAPDPRLPARYVPAMQDVLLERLEPLLRPGVRIADVGGGRHPMLAPERRPPGCRYVGMDVDPSELEAAAPAAYDARVVYDVTRPPPVRREFDVVVSWQVLEHVRPLDVALANLRSLLVPGGTMLAQLSGSFAIFALAARMLPHRARVLAMARLLGHRAAEKFPTHYDRCYERALRRMLAPWSSATILPYYRGARYLDFSPALRGAYLAYESTALDRGWHDLATHYLIVARR